MSAKNKTAIVLGTAGIAFAVMTGIEPHLPDQPAKTPEQIRQERLDKDFSDLSDADEHQKSRHRDDGNELVDANEREKLRPGEHRPPEVPKFRYFPK